jgi:hypothetical protein
MPNFLHPDAVEDVLEGLIQAADLGLPPPLRTALHRLLLGHVRESYHDCHLVRRRSTLPAWTEGKVLHHFVPSAELQAAIRATTSFLFLAQDALRADQLQRNDPGLAKKLAKLIAGIPHRTWLELAADARQLNEQLIGWRRAQDRAWTRRLVPGGQQRQWRRLRSGQELWDAAHGTNWCVRKGQPWSEGYQKAIADKTAAMWVLEDGEQALALARFDVEVGQIVEVRDRDNGPAVRSRAAIRKLARHLGCSVGHDADDMRALALDDELGKRSQPYWSGQIRSSKATAPLRFKLWADGRKGRYLLGVGEDARAAHVFRVRAALAPDGVKIDGTAPPEWLGSEAALIHRCLREVARVNDRVHWRRAMRAVSTLA